MKVIQLAIVACALVFFSVSTSFAQEGTCLLLSIEYSKQWTIQIKAEHEYKTMEERKKNNTMSYGSYVDPTILISMKKNADQAKQKLDKISNALLAHGCYSPEDAQVVKNLIQ